MKIAWTTPALDDLDQIQNYIAQDNPAAAYRLVNAIISRVDAVLSANPLAGRSGRIEGTREFIVPNTVYIVVYRVAHNIEVLAVVNGARAWPTLL